MAPRFRPNTETTPPPSGRGRCVLLLVTGGIAAYKACTVVRRLSDAGCRVRVAMTPAATRFVTPLTFEALSGQAVGTSLWGEGGENPLDHIHWVREAGLVLVAPATADFLAKMAHGLADDLPSTLVTAADVPVLAAPAMNDRMWANPANQDNLRTLRARGVEVIDPGSGHLACGTVAEGRLAEPEAVVARVLSRLGSGPLREHRVLVTAGGTREPIDAVRYVGNRSSGRMGMAVAAAARDLGAEVTLLLGPTEIAPPSRVTVHRFESAADLSDLVTEHAARADAIVMAAAVSDYRPVSPSPTKHKKEQGTPAPIELVATEDILAGLGERRAGEQLLVGFALETGGDDAVERACASKLADKKLDLICGNRADAPGEGFEGDTNRLFLLDRRGHGAWTTSGSKVDLARQVWQRAIELVTAGEDPRHAEAERNP